MRREWKPRGEYLRDKIAYHERKLMWEYDQLARIDPGFSPNFVPVEYLQRVASGTAEGIMELVRRSLGAQ